MTSVRADLWCAAFVRRHNDQGRICVVSRRGDPVAGQVWVQVDHLDGTASLYSKAPALLQAEGTPAEQDSWKFQCRLSRVSPARITDRIAQEERFDPDFWLLVLESRSADCGLSLVQDASS